MLKVIVSCVGLAVVAMTSGCASSIFDPATPGYDAQGCVEEALRRSDDRELAQEASNKFRAACETGDAAACSALGVIAETGLVAAPDRAAAQRLFRRACDGGNPRGCVNLGKLVERASLGENDLTMIASLYRKACDAGEAAGCAALGHALVHGDAASRDRAVDLLGAACRRGQADACFDLAEIERRGSMPGPVALEHYAKACVAGNLIACHRLDPAVTVAER
ncbi:MAG TPA: tetratricopeptide repeat protein [Polyangiaceae bacterium]|nr:tetratricopeptide repeat protein [Polyangiaceae bacterium]